MKSTIPLFLFPALLAPILSAQIVEDDFNDGNDAGWERYSPLDNLGSPLAFTFPARRGRAGELVDLVGVAG